MTNKHTFFGIILLASLAGWITPAVADAVIELPPPQISGGMPLMDALSLRKSKRDFSSEPLSDPMLSSLLWAANGINRPGTTYRTAPSARRWLGIDIYVARADGVFLYEPEPHRLVKVQEDDIRSAAGRQPFVREAPVVLIFVADASRMHDATPEAIAFYSATDTGFISQNVYLFCAANDLSTVVLNWVDKEQLGAVMYLNESRKVVLTQPVGHPRGFMAEPPPVEAEPEAAPAPAWKDGTYRGTAEGYVTDVAVEVLVEEGRIGAVSVVSHSESRTLGAEESIPAAIVSGQDPAEVDAVSGATITSQAIVEAVQQALEQARD